MIPVNAYATALSDFTTENEQRPAQLRFFVLGSRFLVDKEYHSASSAARAKIVHRNFVTPSDRSARVLKTLEEIFGYPLPEVNRRSSC
jgi:hypothetical protein